MTDAEREERQLQEMEDDLGIGNIDLTDIDDDLNTAAKINSARQSSQQLIDNSETRIRPRESIEGTDRPDPHLVMLTRNMSDQLESDVQKLSLSDPDYGAKVNALYSNFSQERFKQT